MRDFDYGGGDDDAGRVKTSSGPHSLTNAHTAAMT